MNSIIGKLKRHAPSFDKGKNGIFTSIDSEKAPEDRLSNGEVFIDLGNGVDESVLVRKTGSIAHSLDALLLDSSALSFFIQYLEHCDKLNLIKFWLHVEGFKSSVSKVDSDKDTDRQAQLMSLLDARNICEKYIDDDSTTTIAAPRRIREAVYENMKSEPLLNSCFEDAQMYVKQLFEHRYFQEFQSSVYYKKHEMDVLSRSCSIYDILHVQSLLLSFIEFIDSQSDQNLLQFLIACESFDNNYDKMEDQDALDDAMSLYDKYFSMQAPSRIDAGDEVRVQMESAICTENGRPSRNSFATAKLIALNQVQQKYLCSFVRSPAYIGYLNDLSTQIENTIELPCRTRTRRGTGSVSDATSSCDSMPLIFSRHFENLDKCPSQETLTFANSPKLQRPVRCAYLAEVDNMGRYKALYDDSLSNDGTSPSKLRQRLRKILDKNTKLEDEVAEHVARTIIADVQSMVEAGRRG